MSDDSKKYFGEVRQSPKKIGEHASLKKLNQTNRSFYRWLNQLGIKRSEWDNQLTEEEFKKIMDSK